MDKFRELAADIALLVDNYKILYQRIFQGFNCKEDACLVIQGNTSKEVI